MYDEVLNLLPKKKKQFWKIIFSRFFVALLLILFQICIFAFLYLWLNTFFKLFSAIQILFSIVMILYLFNSGMDSSAKLTWLYLIMLFPVPTTIMLLISEKDIGHRITKNRVNQLIQETKDYLKVEDGLLNNRDLIESGTDDLHTYLNRSGCFPIYTDTEVEYLPLGEIKFERLLRELEKAEKFIFMEYFIIEEGEMWGRVLNILARKASEGVDVRVMYDGMCEAVLLTHDYPQRLNKIGIKCKPFTAIKPFFSTQYNYRDHRKITVIDGRVAFTGGINLADEYINKKIVYGHWKDAAIMLQGSAVQTFTLMFLQTWNIDEKEVNWNEVTGNSIPQKPDGYVIPYGDSPLDDDKVGEKVYMDILYKAKEYVHIMTPYLILDDEMENAIIYAAQRGIDVKIILPGIPDKPLAYALAKSHYPRLVEAGVKIYEYTPGFVHAKVFVSDDEKGVVGSINLDYRSLYHHFECATYLYKCSCIKNIEDDFLSTLEKCRKVDADSIKKESIVYKTLGIILKPIAPLL